MGQQRVQAGGRHSIYDEPLKRTSVSIQPVIATFLLKVGASGSVSAGIRIVDNLVGDVDFTQVEQFENGEKLSKVTISAAADLIEKYKAIGAGNFSAGLRKMVTAALGVPQLAQQMPEPVLESEPEPSES